MRVNMGMQQFVPVSHNQFLLYRHASLCAISAAHQRRIRAAHVYWCQPTRSAVLLTTRQCAMLMGASV